MKHEKCPRCDKMPLLEKKDSEFYIECRNYPTCRYPTTYGFDTPEEAWKAWDFNARTDWMNHKSERGG